MRSWALLLVMSLAACRQENPDWMGPDPSVGGDAGATASEPATSTEVGTSAAGSDGSTSGGSTCDPDTQLLCGTVCRNILDDRKNCGDCGNMCIGGQQCVDGVCG